MKDQRKRIQMMIAGLVAMALPALLPVTAPAAGVTDRQIADAVETKLLWDSSVFSNDIDVAVRDGIVTLTGKVGDLGEKRRVGRIAKSRHGVRAVVNQVAVSPPATPDPEIKAFADAALNADPVTSEFNVETAVRDGILTLTGEVPGHAAREYAEQVASGVLGVREVDNRMTMNWETDRTDEEIAAQVRRTYGHDLWIDDQFIDVEVADGSVTLSGSVGSPEERDRAVARAWVAGAREVDDTALVVKPWMRNEDRRLRENPALSDEATAEAIRDAFFFDPRVISLNPEIEVNDGVVTLRGTVTNVAAREAAERDARNTVGVNHVINLLKVRNPEAPGDADLEEAIRLALSRDPDTRGDDITVEVSNGRALLEGEVDTAFESAEARAIASGIDGVKEVRNRLEVEAVDSYFFTYPFDAIRLEDDQRLAWDQRPAGSDRRLRDAIEDELFWSWEVDSDDVEVAVESGVAILTGTVDDRGEYDAAEDKARDAGAFAVRNRLLIEGRDDSTASVD